MANLQIPVSEFNDSIHQWQLGILRKFDDKVARFFLLNWHRRARKTTLLINLLIREACKHPNSVYGYIGPTYKQSKAIIWRDPNMLDRYLPFEYVSKRNESELFVEFKNGSILTTKGADDPDSIRGLDFRGVGIDEWALQKKEIWEEILRPVIAQSKDRWAVFAFTPKGQNHAYDIWQNTKDNKDWFKSFLPVSISKLLPDEELVKARAEMPENLYQQEFECSFMAEEVANILIPPHYIEALKDIHFYDTIRGDIISCDPSAGGDECVFYVMRNSKIIDSKFMYEKDTMKVAGEGMVLSARHHILDFAIDSIGIGKPIGDRLVELHKRVAFINSSESPSPMAKTQFYNKRTEMWWYVMQRIMDKEIPYPEDEELRRQLSSVRYLPPKSSGLIRLEPKEETKKRLGRSPDRADAYVYGIYATQFLDPRNQVYKPYKYRDVGAQMGVR